VYRQWEVRQIRHIAVGTDRSHTATPAVELAAEMANRYGAELYVIQVLLPGEPPGTEAGQAEARRAGRAGEELRQIAGGLAGPRGHARVIVDADPAMAMVRAADGGGHGPGGPQAPDAHGPAGGVDGTGPWQPVIVALVKDAIVILGA
jgi:ubiquinone biosynthesis protein